MRALLMIAMLMAAPFWETKDPKDWTMEEVQKILTDSPWVQMDGVPIVLSSAKPVREAEARLKKKSTGDDGPGDTDYEDFLEDNNGKFIVISVPIPDWKTSLKASEIRQMEDSVLKVGKKQYKLAGYFTPTRSDANLRLLFPREGIVPGTKSFRVELYLPALQDPYREAEFVVKDLIVRGKLEI